MSARRVGAENMETQCIGVISDTHGRLPPTAIAVLEGVGSIIHAGDIDTPEVLERLCRIAPTKAVRGNMDRGAWAAHLPSADMIDVGNIRIYVRHIIGDIDLDPVTARVDLVISGHTHRCEQTRKNGVIYLNPGSACLPRAGNPASMAVVTIAGSRTEIRFVTLEGGK